MKNTPERKGIRAGLDYIKKTLDNLTDEKAAEVLNILIEVMEETTQNEINLPHRANLAFVIGPAMATPGEGRPEKESQRASRPTLSDLIITPGDCNLTKPQQIKRIEYLLKEYVKRPRDLAHLAIAIEGEKWAHASALKTAFYDIAKDIIKDDRKTGKISSFKDARERAERPGTKQNENNTIKNNLDKFKALLQSKEI